jgi:hypothetical protein
MPDLMPIVAGDIVQVSQRGRLFFARVVAVGAGGGLSVAPLDRAVATRRAAPSEVVDHWSRAARPANPRAPRDQLDLNEWIED